MKRWVQCYVGWIFNPTNICGMNSALRRALIFILTSHEVETLQFFNYETVKPFGNFFDVKRHPIRFRINRMATDIRGI